MPRTARASVGGICYHVLNRGNGRAEVFHKPQDYEAFLGLIQAACERLPMRVTAYCLMPNHFHLALWPYEDGDLSRWMQWLMTSHVRRYHRHYNSSGHVWGGRFKAFPIQADDHLLAVHRYIERNPLRAGLVSRAREWAWASLAERSSSTPSEFLQDGPVRLPDLASWRRRVNQAESESDLKALRESVNRGRPFGNDPWTTRTATQLALESTLTPRGRPRKAPPVGQPSKK